MADDAPIFDTGERCEFPGCENAKPTSTGRGRPPKYCELHSSKSRTSGGTTAPRNKGTADAKRAAESINDTYTGIVYVLMLAGLPRAASDLVESLPGLQERNEKHLANNPALCKRINDMSSKTGILGMIAANAMVIVPVMLTAGSELAVKREARRAADTESGELGEPGTGEAFYPGTTVPMEATV